MKVIGPALTILYGIDRCVRIPRTDKPILFSFLFYKTQKNIKIKNKNPKSWNFFYIAQLVLQISLQPLAPKTTGNRQECLVSFTSPNYLLPQRSPALLVVSLSPPRVITWAHSIDFSCIKIKHHF